MKYLIAGLVVLILEFGIPLLDIFPIHNEYSALFVALFSIIYLCIGYFAGVNKHIAISVIFFLIGVISALYALFILMFVNAWR